MVPAPNPTRRAVVAGLGALLTAGCLGGASTTAGGSGDGNGWKMYGRDPGRTRHVPDADVP
ncbi:hypothetical protein [Halobiforma nitratireducens]|uniref:hypothetical protein n=1 Tax=Halobiforma nitratireducens TaxID=130048 RepID=UPI001EF9D918|nr:hypothetical protein [Halobiforma nitratireducens]